MSFWSRLRSVFSGRADTAAGDIAQLPSVVIKLPEVPGVVDSKPTKDDRFVRSVAFVLKHEGGFVDHPRDPGGATNMGITIGTLRDWRGRPVSVDDVKNLTDHEARQIYRARYWNPVNGDMLPQGINLSVFDFAVNAGVGRAARTLQRVVGVPDDGIIGPMTMAALKGIPEKDLIIRFAQARREFYKGLSTFDAFGRGWIRRTNECEQESLRMVGENQ